MKAIEKLMVRILVLAGTLTAVSAMATQHGVPQPRTENGITYVAGGIGEDEAKAMLREARRYPLSLVFSANKDNEYLADVDVTIKNEANKEVLSVNSDGPIMLLRLPAGRYTIEAEVEGKTLHRSVQVRDSDHERVFLHWPNV